MNKSDTTLGTKLLTSDEKERLGTKMLTPQTRTGGRPNTANKLEDVSQHSALHPGQSVTTSCLETGFYYVTGFLCGMLAMWLVMR